MAGQMSACPHCGQETKLNTTAISNDIPVEAKQRKSYLTIVSLIVGIVAAVICWISFSGHFVKWSKSPVVTLRDIKVAIKKISVPSDSPMQITLSVANLSTARKVDFTGWSGAQLNGSSATLADNNQNSYRLVIDGMAPDNTIYPQQEASDTISFETSVENIQWLHLELPVKNFGGSGMLRFEISNDRIKQIRKALAGYASFVANNGYLTNADYVKVAQKHKDLERYYENLQKQSQTPEEKLALVKFWNENLVKQWGLLDAQLAGAQAHAIAMEYNKITAAELGLAAAETNMEGSPQ